MREIWPTLNAGLNALSGLLLLMGYSCIRHRRVRGHWACMVGAFGVSTMFLVSYSLYHAQVGTTRFAGEGWVRAVYLAILLSHTLLAALIVPLAVAVLGLALRRRFEKHRRWARWTLPLWLYVSASGVAVYLMLYHLYPSR